MWTTTGRSSEWHRWQWGWWEANRTALHRALGYHRGWQGRKKRENQVQTRPMLLSLCWLEGVLPFKKQHEAEGNDYLLLLSQLQKLSHLCVLPVRSHKCCLLFLIVLESWFKIICIKKKRGGQGSVTLEYIWAVVQCSHCSAAVKQEKLEIFLSEISPSYIGFRPRPIRIK